MIRIIVMTLVFLALTAAALHAQVPYTQLPPLPGWTQPQPRQPLFDPRRELYRQFNESMQPQFSPSEPQRKPRVRQRGGVYGNVFGNTGLTHQPYQPQETEYDRMMREFRAESDRIAEQTRREFQNDNIERAIRCNRFGSREVYADCHNW